MDSWQPYRFPAEEFVLANFHSTWFSDMVALKTSANFPTLSGVRMGPGFCSSQASPLDAFWPPKSF